MSGEVREHRYANPKARRRQAESGRSKYLPPQAKPPFFGEEGRTASRSSLIPGLGNPTPKGYARGMTTPKLRCSKSGCEF